MSHDRTIANNETVNKVISRFKKVKTYVKV